MTDNNTDPVTPLTDEQIVSVREVMLAATEPDFDNDGMPSLAFLNETLSFEISELQRDMVWNIAKESATGPAVDYKLTDEERTKIKHAMLSLTEEDFDSNGKPRPDAIDDKTGFFLGHEAIAELWAEVVKDRDDARRAVIKMAMRGMKPHQFILSGVPGTDALEDLLGYNIPAKERDELWAEVEAEDAAAEPEPEGEPYIMIRIPGIRLEQALAIAKAVGVTVGARRVHVLQDKAVSVNIDDSTAEEARAACIVALTHEGFPRVENFVKIKRSHLVR